MKKNWIIFIVLLSLLSDAYTQVVAPLLPLQNQTPTTEQKIELLVQQAELYAEQKDFRSAIESLSKAMDLKITTYEYKYNLSKGCYLTECSEENGYYQPIIENCFRNKVVKQLSLDSLKLIIGSLEGTIKSAQFYLTLAEIITHTFKSDFAIELTQKCLTLSRLTKNKLLEFEAIYQLGEVFYWQERHKEATPYFMDALEMSTRMKDTFRTIHCLVFLAYTNIGQFKLDKAEAHLKEALPLAYATEDRYSIFYCLRKLRDVESYRGNYKEVRTIEKQIREIVEAQGDPYHLMIAKKGEAITQKEIGNYKSALPLLQETAKWNENAKNTKEYSKVYCNIADCFQNLGIYDSAVIYFQKSIHYALIPDNKIEPLYNLYLFYNEIGDQKTALVYLNKYKIQVDFLNNREDLKSLSKFYEMRATFFFELEQLDSAIYFTKKNIDLLKESNLVFNLLQHIVYLGRIYQKQENWETASKHFQEVLTSSCKIGLKTYTCESLYYLAEITLAQGKNEQAIDYANESLQIAKNNHQFSWITKTYATLSKANEKINNFERALNYQRMAKTIKDSLLGFTQYSQIIHYEAKFNIQEKEQENQQLRFAKEQNEIIVQSRTSIIKYLIVSILFIFLINYFLKERAKLKVKNTMRQQLAKDIHDDVGGIINNLKRTAKEALEKKSDGALVEQKLNQTIQLGNEAMNSLKDLIWKLEKEETVLEQLEKEIIAFTEKVFSLHQITYQLNITGFKIPQPLTTEHYNNLMMIYKEVLQNIVKHGGKEQVNIVWKYENKKVILITKNLIPPSANSVKNHSIIHRGLENIKKRAAAINGWVNFKKINGFFELDLVLNL